LVDVASGFAFGYDPTSRSVLFKVVRIPNLQYSIVTTMYAQ
jgi:hypothetical protein